MQKVTYKNKVYLTQCTSGVHTNTVHKNKYRGDQNLLKCYMIFKDF
jgi:hypothetical protein